MKNLVCMFAVISVCLCACSNNKEVRSGQITSNTKSVDDVIEDQINPPALEVVEKPKASDIKVDIDLTKEDSNMVYSLVSDMLENPNDYINKTVRIEGIVSSSDYNGNTYHFCLVQDATACCSQGFEFATANGKYPNDGKTVIIRGTFSTYTEDGMMYLNLADSEVEE